MPTEVEIEINLIAKTVVDREAVRRWLGQLGADNFEMPPQDTVSDPALLVALAGKRCYMSFQKGLNPNINRIREDYATYFDNILRSGHGSVLEHASYTFAIDGVSRVFTAEMNRHRAGWAISEGSLRFIRFDKDIPYWLPMSIRVQPDDDDDLKLRKKVTRRIFERAFQHQEDCYSQMLDVWDMDEGHHNFAYKKKVTSMMRRIIGLGVATGGIWTGNVRALRHVLTMRCSPGAEEEICHVFSRVAKEIRDVEPLMFGDFHQDDQGYWLPKYVKV